MGGTTAKLSLVDGGEPLTAYSFEAARQRRFIEGSGLPIRISTIELIEIGAGGGSIAAVDEIGLLKVGPRSAGSHPGPASYGQGGREPTVTDADFLLGYLNPDYFAGGEVAVDMAAALAAVEGLSRRLGLESTKVAWGIHDIVNENMAGAARVHIAERGRDPRDYALLCTGGAGPVHAYSVARKLGIGRVICPPSAGVASALGLLVAPARVDRVATVGIRLDQGSIAALEAAFARLEAEARAVMAETGLKLESATVQRLADGRFLGQGFDLVVPLPPGPYEDSGPGRAVLRGAFETAYRNKFALTPPGVPVEFINIRVAVRAPVSGSEVVLEGRGGGGARAALKGTRRAYFPGAEGWVEAAVYDRYRLGVGDELAGPAVVEEEGSTLVVGPGATARVAESGNIVMTLAPHHPAPHHPPPHPTLSPSGARVLKTLSPEGRGQGEGWSRSSNGRIGSSDRYRTSPVRATPPAPSPPAPARQQSAPVRAPPGSPRRARSGSPRTRAAGRARPRAWSCRPADRARPGTRDAGGPARRPASPPRAAGSPSPAAAGRCPPP
jgi:N-methylhydantoinase A